jgi:benzoate membrane transport protein
VSDRSSNAVPITAGVVCSLVGFTSSFAVVLAGFRAVGASPTQAASGLIAVTVTMGLSSILLSWHFRMPITCAWSTPGSALLVSTGAVVGGWPAAVGAFFVTGALLVLTGLWPGLSAAVSRIPTPVAQAMLAGVLLPLCLAPVHALAHDEVAVGPVLLLWLVLLRFRPRLAVPVAFIAAMIVAIITVVHRGTSLPAAQLLPHIAWTTPTLGLQALTGIAIPLYVVTMASQNITGVAVMNTFGYRTPWRASLTVTGLGSLLGAGLGGHAVNLAAISAALAAGPDAGPDRDRRWIASVSAGCCNLVLALVSAALSAIVLAVPGGVIQAVAGVALLGAFASAVAGAFTEEPARIPAAVTFVVAASGTVVAGISAGFWALVIGIVVYRLLTTRATADQSSERSTPSPASR